MVFQTDHTGNSKHHLPTTQEMTLYEHHQLDNTKIKLFVFFAAEDRETVYSQQEQEQELIVAHIMNSLLQNSELNWRKLGKSQGHSGKT